MQHTEQLGDLAIGTIGPNTRIKEGEISEEAVEELAARLLTDEFYVPVHELGPQAAGGTFSLVVADALTTGRYMDPSRSTTDADHAQEVYRALLETSDTPEARAIIPRRCIDGRLPDPSEPHNDSLIGGHDSDGAKDGCGAQKELGNILRFLAEPSNADAIRTVGVDFGFEADDDTHDLIQGRARMLLATGYVTSGINLRKAYVDVAGEKVVSKLIGTHREVVASDNKDANMTLDGRRIAEAFGESYEAFGVDSGVFRAAAGVVSLTEREAEQKAVAMAYYNIATTLVLSNPSLRLQHRANA